MNQPPDRQPPGEAQQHPPPAASPRQPTQQTLKRPLRWLAALLALAGITSPATADPSANAPVITRLDTIRQRLIEADRLNPGEPEGQAGETGQWFNWPNWANWSKWSKWNNWNNWGKQ